MRRNDHGPSRAARPLLCGAAIALLLTTITPAGAATKPAGGSAATAAQAKAAASALLRQKIDDRERDLRVRSAALDIELAKASGLADALGGPDAAATKLASLGQSINNGLTGARANPPKVKFAFPDQTSVSDASGGLLFAGYMAAALGTGVGIDASKNEDFASGPKDASGGYEAEGGSGQLILKATRDRIVGQMNVKAEKDGITGSVKTTSDVSACPDAKGTVNGKITIDTSAVATGTTTGQNATLEVSYTATVNDEGVISDTNVTTRMQMSQFSGGKGGFLDVTITTPIGAGATIKSGFKVNRTGGTVTDQLATSATLLGTILGLTTAALTANQTEKGWQDGRCVVLNVKASPGPTGLKPSSQASIVATPRSRLDGAPVGGTVAATLSAGGAAVAPAKLAADATFRYTAPAESGKSGTVTLVSKSRRGVAKAEVSFSTGGKASYHVVGGLEDWQVSQDVCDVLAPFTLTAEGIGTAKFSGGLTGTYSATGIFDAQYAGTYVITLPNGIGQPGTMDATSGGSVAGQAGFGTEKYVLTPITC